MRIISIKHEDKPYNINLTDVNAYPYGYYKIEWDNETLLEIKSSPIYIEHREENRLVLPSIKNFEELTFVVSIIHGIFEDNIINQTF